MEDGRVKIVVVDDHAVVRAGLRMVLEEQPDIEVVGEADSIDSARRVVSEQGPDVTLLDLSLGGESGLAAIGALRAASPGTVVLVLTMHDDPELAAGAIEAGAAGYVLKQAADEQLVEALRAALEGRTWTSPELAAPRNDQERGSDLTPRETEVLELVALGHTGGEIAEQLSLSVRTVESHRASIQRKLDLTTRAELVRYALDHGLIAKNDS